MFYRFTLLFPLVCLTLAPSSLAWAADPENVVTDEQILRTVGLSCDGPALVQFLRNRSLGEFDRKEIEALVDKLDSPQAEERDRAAGELVARGAPAIPLLRQALRDPDAPRIAAGARRCLQYLEGDQGTVLPAAVVRLLAQKKPAGAVPALLDYLPFADDEAVLDEIKEALGTLTEKDPPSFALLLRAWTIPPPCAA